MSGSTGAAPARTARYVPGAGSVVVRGDVLVALPYAPAERSAAVWDALDGAAGVMDALQVLSSTFDAGLAALPPFAVVVLTSGGRAHVLVRGDVEVRVDGRDGPTDLHGRDVSTWTERAVEGVDGVSVRLGASAAAGAPDDAPTTLPLVGGVVRAKTVSWGTVAWAQDAARPGESVTAGIAGSVPAGAPADVAAHRTSSAAPAATSGAPAPADVPGLVTAVPGLVSPAAPAAVAEPVVVAPAADGPTADGPAADGLATPSELTLAPMETIAPGSTAGTDVEPAPGDAPAGAGVGPGEPELLDVPADDAAPAAADRPVADEYESLWETTIHRSVEEAAVRTEEPDEEVEAAAGPALVSGVPRDFPAPPAPSAASPAVTAPPTPAPPTATPPTTEPPAADGQDGPDGFDHDGQTVMGSSVADLRAVAAAAAAQLAASGDLPAFAAGPGTPAPTADQPVAGPPLVARLCASGHPNPPSREHCASCGLPLSGQTQTVARPPLGRVRVTVGEGEGQVFALDRPLVVGRRPRSPKGAGGGGDAALHRIVTVPSPQQDISRSHVEVRLEGWNVLAVDLNTTNGTTLLRSGQSPLRLHPGDPQLVVSGDVVDLGDGVTLAFEEVP